MMTALRYLVGVVRYWCRAFNIWGLTIKVFLKKKSEYKFQYVSRLTVSCYFMFNSASTRLLLDRVS